MYIASSSCVHLRSFYTERVVGEKCGKERHVTLRAKIHTRVFEAGISRWQKIYGAAILSGTARKANIVGVASLSAVYDTMVSFIGAQL